MSLFERDFVRQIMLRPPGAGRPGPRPDLSERLRQAGLDPAAIIDVAADACADVPAHIVAVLSMDTADRTLHTVATRHADAATATALSERLVTGPARTAGTGPRLDAVTTVSPLPIERAALPEALREVLDAEGIGHLIIAPVVGQAFRLGLLVLGRTGNAPAFTDAERQAAVAVGERCGAALELVQVLGDVGRQAALIDLLDDAIVAVNRREVVTTWNAAAERMYGVPAGEAVGRPLRDLYRTTYLEDGDEASAYRQVLSVGSWQARVRQTSRTGRTIEVDAKLSVVRDADGNDVGVVAVNRDVTALVTAPAGAQAQSRFAQELMDALDTRGAVLDGGGRVIAMNARWRSAIGDRGRCTCGPVALGESWLEALARGACSEARRLAADLDQLLSGRRSTAHAECHCPAGGPDGTTAIEVVRIDAGQGGAIVVQSDVSWRRRMQDELTFRATHDELTGLPNRAALMEGLTGSLQRLGDDDRKLAVLFCDLDGFKDINDGLGHTVGDQVLIAVARRLRQRCRSADVVARFGGDEFVVVLSIEELAQAVAMADRIVEVLGEPIVVGDVEVASGVSVGVTVVDLPPDDDDPVGTLLRDADTAMYHAKGRGRGRYELYDARLRENTVERLELAAALHRAISDDELEIHYQARRHCGDRRIVGVEALLQWRHPDHGLVDPEKFIPIAERTGRIIELGEWVLRRALLEFARLGDGADRRITLAVNVSPRQLTSARLAEGVAAALAETGVEPCRLVLEITESAFVDDPGAARAVLTELRELGVTIALDDFGTGWSSLSYLRTLPVDVLKIDKSFVKDLPTDLDACAVVSAVLGLGHGMGLVVVAEGVEHEDHLSVLRDMGCDEYQGFIDGRPGPLAQVLAPAAIG